MNVLVIDGQGGGLGRQLVAALSAQCPDIRLVAVGTNSVAAQAMHKAGAPSASLLQMRCWGRSPPPWPRRCARAAPPGC